jgi:hypothetical protein
VDDPIATILDCGRRAEMVALQLHRCELAVEEAARRGDVLAVETAHLESGILYDSVLRIRQEQLEAQIALAHQPPVNNGPWVAGRRWWWQFWLPRRST